MFVRSFSGLVVVPMTLPRLLFSTDVVEVLVSELEDAVMSVDEAALDVVVAVLVAWLEAETVVVATAFCSNLFLAAEDGFKAYFLADL